MRRIARPPRPNRTAIPTADSGIVLRESMPAAMPSCSNADRRRVCLQFGRQQDAADRPHRDEEERATGAKHQFGVVPNPLGTRSNARSSSSPSGAARPGNRQSSRAAPCRPAARSRGTARFPGRAAARRRRTRKTISRARSHGRRPPNSKRIQARSLPVPGSHIDFQFKICLLKFRRSSTAQDRSSQAVDVT